MPVSLDFLPFWFNLFLLAVKRKLHPFWTRDLGKNRWHFTHNSHIYIYTHTHYIILYYIHTREREKENCTIYDSKLTFHTILRVRNRKNANEVWGESPQGREYSMREGRTTRGDPAFWSSEPPTRFLDTFLLECVRTFASRVLWSTLRHTLQPTCTPDSTHVCIIYTQPQASKQVGFDSISWSKRYKKINIFPFI